MRKSDSQSQILWREFLNRSATSNSVKNSNSVVKDNENIKPDRDNSDLSKISMKAKVSQYKSQEEYYDEIILLKKNIVTMRGENELLKSKIRKADEILCKKDKELSEIINHFENQSIVKDSSSTNFIFIKKLQQQVFQLKSELKIKEDDILNIKNDIKFTKINEIKIQNDVYLQEIRSLKQIISNFQKDNQNLKMTKPKITTSSQCKLSSCNEKYKILFKKYQAILKENKSYEKERDQFILNESNRYENNKEIKQKQLREKGYSVEIELLKSVNSDLLNEKVNVEKKLSNLSSKYEHIQEKLDLKNNEYEILKRKIELQNNKTLTKPKIDDMQHKTDDEKNNKLVQIGLLSYFSRELILQNNSINPNRDSIDIISSTLIGYFLRERLLNR